MAASGARAEQSPKPIDLSIALRCESLSDYTGGHITVSIEDYKEALAELLNADPRTDISSFRIEHRPYKDLLYEKDEEISFSHGVGDPPGADGLIISGATPNIITIDTDSNNIWSRMNNIRTYGSLDRHTGAGTLYHVITKPRYSLTEQVVQCEPAPAAKF